MITSRTLAGWRTSSKYEEVPDNYISLTMPSIIYFRKLQANSSTIKMTPTIMITNRNLMRMEDVLQVWLLTTIFHLTPQIEYIFWKPQPLLNSSPSPTFGANFMCCLVVCSFEDFLQETPTQPYLSLIIIISSSSMSMSMSISVSISINISISISISIGISISINTNTELSTEELWLVFLVF